jgi:hypothetical protein
MKPMLIAGLMAVAALTSASAAGAAAGRLHMVNSSRTAVAVAVNGHNYGKVAPGAVTTADLAFSGGEAELPAVLTPDGGSAVRTTLWLSEENAVRGKDGLQWCIKLGADFAMVMPADDCQRVIAGG